MANSYLCHSNCNNAAPQGEGRDSADDLNRQSPFLKKYNLYLRFGTNVALRFFSI